MFSPAIYSFAGASLVLLALLFHFMSKTPVEQSKLRIFQAISKETPVLSSFVSTKIKGTADEIFAAIIDYKEYPTWSPFTAYKWEDTDAEGVPLAGSNGTFKIKVDLLTRTIPIRLKTLDREKRRVSEESITYPNWLLRSERIQEVVPMDNEPGFCEYRTRHDLYGLASNYLLLTSKEDLADSQAQYAGDLKLLVEGKIRFKTTKR